MFCDVNFLSSNYNEIVFSIYPFVNLVYAILLSLFMSTKRFMLFWTKGEPKLGRNIDLSTRRTIALCTQQIALSTQQIACTPITFSIFSKLLLTNLPIRNSYRPITDTSPMVITDTSPMVTNQVLRLSSTKTKNQMRFAILTPHSSLPTCFFFQKLSLIFYALNCQNKSVQPFESNPSQHIL